MKSMIDLIPPMDGCGLRDLEGSGGGKEVVLEFEIEVRRG